MLINLIIFVLLSQSIFISGAAGNDIATKLTLLDCYDCKLVAMPGTGMHCRWTAHHTVLPVAEMSDDTLMKLDASLSADTAKILCCYIGSVEGDNKELIDKVMAAIAKRLHPNNPAWIKPFDDVGEWDLKTLIPDAVPAEQLSSMRSLFIRFRCTNDCPFLYRKDAQGGIFKSSIIVPTSFNKHALAMLKKESMLFNDDERRSLGLTVKMQEITSGLADLLDADAREQDDVHEATSFNDNERRILRLMVKRQEIASELVGLLDADARKQDDFHETTYLALNPVKFAAFAAQEFGH